MRTTHKSTCTLIAVSVAIVICCAAPGSAQVSPVEILNPRLKAIEQAYLTRLTTVNRAIAKLSFPFALSLNRYAGLDPREQIGADARGLEFVNFHDRLVLKLTGNYNAAYNADLLTANQRSNRVFEEVIVPILGLLPTYFSQGDDFDFGFEVAYHVRRRANGYEVEGKEILVVVLDKADVLSYSLAQQDSKRQEVLNRSEIYVDGKPFGLALGERDPLDVETLERSVSKRRAPVSAPPAVSASASTDADEVKARAIESQIPLLERARINRAISGTPREEQIAVASEPSQADADVLQEKYKSQLDALGKEGPPSLHFVDYAPPSFVVVRKQIYLQITLRNPEGFDKDATSIYKRAARAFDLFLAPQLKLLLEKLPGDAEISGLDITVLNELSSKSSHPSEAVEFICTLKGLRQFTAAEITNQALIDQSLVLVNGVRIALNLQQVE